MRQYYSLKILYGVLIKEHFCGNKYTLVEGGVPGGPHVPQQVRGNCQEVGGRTDDFRLVLSYKVYFAFYYFCIVFSVYKDIEISESCSFFPTLCASHFTLK